MRRLEAKERILVIEDSPDIATFLVDTVLHPTGYETVLATTGQEGLRLALDVEPDLIFLDLNLSQMTGMEVLQGLRDTAPSIPIALMIFAGSEELAVEAFRMGVKSYVIKPLKPADVLKAIEVAMRETRLRREKELLTEELMRANKEVERRVRELTMLHEITQSVTSSAELETILSRVVEVGVFLCSADEGMLFLIDEDTDEIYLRATKGVGDKRASLLLLPARDSLIGQVVRSGEPLRIASSDPRLDLTVKTGYMVNALLYVPMKIRGLTRGVLAVSNRISDRAFTRTDQSRLALLADHTVIALEMARPRVPGTTAGLEAVGGAVVELAGYVHRSVKAFAADTYTLKASAERGATMCADDTLNQLLGSMERSVAQMASVTEMLNSLVSPDSSEVDRERVQRRLERLKVRHLS